jgi:hypothetical protein
MQAQYDDINGFGIQPLPTPNIEISRLDDLKTSFLITRIGW